VYKNKTQQLHGNIYCNRYSKCSAFFQHIRHQNWGICHTVVPTSVYCVVEVCRLGLEPLCSGVSCSGTHRAHNFLNNRCSVPISCNKEREMTTEFRKCEAMLCAFRNLITDRTSQSAGAGIRASIFNSCNTATVRTQEVPLCMRHATALLYHECAVALRNIRFASCGTSGKLTLWMHYVCTRIPKL
jgi:hypothetical protein